MSAMLDYRPHNPALARHLGSVPIVMKRVLLISLVILAAPPLSNAAEPNIVETRQAGQDLLSADFAGIRAVVAANGDVKTLADPAKAIARWIRQFPTQFPAGTEKIGGTKALPAVWSDPAGFQKAANVLADAADKLAVLAKAGDTDGVASQVKVVGEACGACHRAFRER
jgi:cytochrome c556